MEHYICKIANLLDGIRNVPVSLSVYDGGSFATGPHHMMVHRCSPETNTNRIISVGTSQVVEFFKGHKVETLYYAGLSLPGCVEARPLGMTAMSEDFNVVVIADCTLDLLNSHKNNYDRINEMFRYMAKMKHRYVFSADVIEAARQYR
jgi:hypothetical protein